MRQKTLALNEVFGMKFIERNVKPAECCIPFILESTPLALPAKESTHYTDRRSVMDSAFIEISVYHGEYLGMVVMRINQPRQFVDSVSLGNTHTSTLIRQLY